MLLTWAGVLDVECRYCCSVSMPISVAQHIRYEVDRRSPGMSQAVGINTPKHVPVQGVETTTSMSGTTTNRLLCGTPLRIDSLLSGPTYCRNMPLP